MNGKELFSVMRNNKIPDRIPFVPTIYEHGAKIIGKTPSQVAQCQKLIAQSQLEAYKLYRHDLISVGMDIYNVEAEALGARVLYYDNADLPSVSDVLVKEKKDLALLKIPDPSKDGRMPLFIEATYEVYKQVGDEVLVSGAVVGPFTLAAILRGFENFIMDLVFDTEFALMLMRFAKDVGLAYAKGFVSRGLGISINESWIAPPLLSPDIYADCVYLIEKEMIDEIKAMGLQSVSLISGGNTTHILENMLKTGTSLVMADYNTDQKYFKEVCENHDVFLRASIESKLVEAGDTQALESAVRRVVEQCGDYPKFLFGCGIVSYDTTTENVLKLKTILNDIR